MFQRSVPVRLEAEETVVRDLRRHGIVVFWRILPPCAVLLVPIVIILVALLGFGSDPAQASALVRTSLIALLILALPMAGWIGLTIYDWSNDSFHITTRRVIRSEQRFWISQNVISAGIQQIQNVAVVLPDPLANLMNYGTVVIETAAQVGKIEFDNVHEPRSIQRLLFQLRGIPMPPEQEPPLINRLSDVLNMIFPFAPQTKPDGSILYHKHWYILVQAVGFTTVLIMAALVASAVLNWLVPMLALILLLPVLLYQYVNWVNDVYILTANRIIDIVRIPLIKEDRREALLEQIQNVTVNVPNFGSKLLDMGDVFVETAGKAENFLFKTVEHPTAVAEEINRRLDDVRSGRKQAEQDSRRREIEAVVAQILQTQQGTPPPPTAPAQ